jgi:hypothetical protein
MHYGNYAAFWPFILIWKISDLPSKNVKWPMTRLLSSKYSHTDWPCTINFLSVHSFICISLSKTKTPRIPIHRPNPLQHPMKCTNVRYINTFYEHDNTARSFTSFSPLVSFMQPMPASAAFWSITHVQLTTYPTSPVSLVLQCRFQCSPYQRVQSRSVWAKMTSHLQSSCW